MEMEELAVGFSPYCVLKGPGIDTVEDLCVFTAKQLLRLGNFGQKSLDEVKHDLLRVRFLSKRGLADSRLLFSFPSVGARFNLGLSTVKRDRESLASYTVRDLCRIEARLQQVGSGVAWRTRSQLLSAIGHVECYGGFTRQFWPVIIQNSRKASSAVAQPRGH
jgi:hypothetical protein